MDGMKDMKDACKLASIDTEDGCKGECAPNDAEEEAEKPQESGRQRHQVPEIDVAVVVEVKETKDSQCSIVRAHSPILVRVEKGRRYRLLCASFRLRGVELVYYRIPASFPCFEAHDIPWHCAQKRRPHLKKNTPDCVSCHL
jgi:hypothetical protein